MQNEIIVNAANELCENGFFAYYQYLVNHFRNGSNRLTYNQFSYRTQRATLPLQNTSEALFYTVAYAHSHYISMKTLMEGLNFDDGTTLQIIDYGCGQGLASIALMSYLHDNNLAKGRRVHLVLIEPSRVSLQMAQYVCTRLASAYGINLTMTTQACHLSQAMIEQDEQYDVTVHLMSNILDIANVQSSLQQLVNKMQTIAGEHVIFASSPIYSDTIKGFARLKNLLPNAETMVDEQVQLNGKEYKVVQGQWQRTQYDRQWLVLYWETEDVDMTVAA